MSTSGSSEHSQQWMSALEARHLSELRFAEVTRALRALSSAYVERRHKVASGSTLDSAGKRAAFALYYGPLHFIATQQVVRELSAETPAHVLDLGCGTGTVGAAWALTSPASAAVTGIDRHPWAVDEAKRTYRELGVNGHARVGDIARLPTLRGDTAVVAGYVLNELPEAGAPACGGSDRRARRQGLARVDPRADLREASRRGGTKPWPGWPRSEAAPTSGGSGRRSRIWSPGSARPRAWITGSSALERYSSPDCINSQVTIHKSQRRSELQFRSSLRCELCIVNCEL